MRFEKLGTSAFRLLLLLLSTKAASAAVVIPTLHSSSNLNVFSTAGVNQLTNSSGLLDEFGMSTTLDQGVDFAEVTDVTHLFDGGFQQSYVTTQPNGESGDYFDNNQPPPQVVWDLGSVQVTDQVALWNYQNHGGGGSGSTQVGNNARVIRFELGISEDFSNPANYTTVTVTLLRGNDPSFGSVLNQAQVFELGGVEARYVRMTIEDNFFGQPGISAGGDRVGLGEIRFNARPVPEAETLAFLLLGVFSLFRRRC